MIGEWQAKQRVEGVLLGIGYVAGQTAVTREVANKVHDRCSVLTRGQEYLGYLMILAKEDNEDGDEL